MLLLQVSINSRHLFDFVLESVINNLTVFCGEVQYSTGQNQHHKRRNNLISKSTMLQLIGLKQK